ncbi:MAG TPA: SAM-dependent methyltransferase [Bacillota bacterium]|nr:SAM-dependent methyltransferase [Bacillota bacterium]
MKIADQVLDILAECRTEGNTLCLPDKQLDRKTYEDVNKCIVNIGGKWNRKAKGHVFDYDPAEALDNLILTGETTSPKNVFQFFPTPRPIAKIMCDMAEINQYSRVLEPSAGNGALIEVIAERGPESIYVVELNPDMERYLIPLKEQSLMVDRPFFCEIDDFLTLNLKNKISVNRIIMNPPFTKQQDIDHIREAFSVLYDGGIMVSIVSESPFFRTNRKSEEFRSFLTDNNAEIVPLPEGAFKESGTMVRTRIIKIKKHIA